MRRYRIAVTVVTMTFGLAAPLSAQQAPKPAAPVGAGQGAGTASGTLTVASKPVKIAHAYASSGPGFFDKSKTDTTVVLSDVELTPANLADLQSLAAAGKVHAIVLVIDAEKQIISCQMHDAAFRMSASTAGSNNKFDATTFTKTQIAGKAYTVKPDTFGPRDVPYEFSVTFDAPIRAK